MWVQSGFCPSLFWEQTPRHFQLIMQGVRKRLSADSDSQTALAWQTGAFSAAGAAGKLKPLHTYLGKQKRKMSNKEMLANMRILAARANRSYGEK